MLNHSAFGSEVLYEVVKPVIDSVQEQMEGMAEVYPSIKVYRSEDTDRSNVVTTCPTVMEDAHGVLTQIIGKVVTWACSNLPPEHPIQDESC